MEGLILRLAYDILAILVTLVVAVLISWVKKKLGIGGTKKEREELEATIRIKRIIN
ncbi:MAG: hypothetical protein ACOX0E_06475 [Syntrophomonadaceae bacterium]|jgi:hypothetical protein